MARSVTVLAEANDDQGRNIAGLELDTRGTTWRRNDTPSAGKVFRTRSGKYRVVRDPSGPGSVTELLGSSPSRVGKLVGLDPNTVTNGATGSGLSDETGRSLRWKVDGISDS